MQVCTRLRHKLVIKNIWGVIKCDTMLLLKQDKSLLIKQDIQWLLKHDKKLL